MFGDFPAKIPNIHRIYMVLANLRYVSQLFHANKTDYR